MRLLSVVMLGLVLLPGACVAPRPKLDVRHPDPSIKIPAIKKAVQEQDHVIIAQLIEDLDSNDPAVRLYAIQALRRMTGEDHGYHYWDDSLARAPAIARWRAWWAEQQGANRP